MNEWIPCSQFCDWKFSHWTTTLLGSPMTKEYPDSFNDVLLRMSESAIYLANISYQGTHSPKESMSQLFLANSCHIMDFPYSMGMPLGYTVMEFHFESVLQNQWKLA